ARRRAGVRVPTLTRVEVTELVAENANTTLSLPGLRRLDGSNVYARGSATVSLTGVDTYLGAETYNTVFEARDASSLINLSALETLHGGVGYQALPVNACRRG